MKFLFTIIVLTFYFSNSFAVDCDDIGVKKIPKMKTCVDIKDNSAKNECILSLLEQPLNTCLDIADSISRNKCIVAKTVELIAAWPVECVQLYRKDIISRIQKNEKAKYGKSTYEANEELKKKYKEKTVESPKLQKDNKPSAHKADVEKK